ncbi:MAG: MoaD family protein [Kiritimatiellae bacterium]|nr:MoaD family protein [Kiritimatiellia bacterium]
MPITVRIPTPLRSLTNDQEIVETEGQTVQEAIQNLQNQFPGIQERVCDDHGELRRFVNLYVNDEDIRFQQGKETPLKDGDELSIIPAIAGGITEKFQI